MGKPIDFNPIDIYSLKNWERSPFGQELYPKAPSLYSENPNSFLEYTSQKPFESFSSQPHLYYNIHDPLQEKRIDEFVKSQFDESKHFLDLKSDLSPSSLVRKDITLIDTASLSQNENLNTPISSSTTTKASQKTHAYKSMQSHIKRLFSTSSPAELQIMLPGLFSVLFMPFYFVKNFIELTQNIINEDMEGTLDSFIRAPSHLFSTCYSTMNLALLTISHAKYIPYFAVASTGAGLSLCLFEGLIEAIAATRELSFLFSPLFYTFKILQLHPNTPHKNEKILDNINAHLDEWVEKIGLYIGKEKAEAYKEIFLNEKRKAHHIFTEENIVRIKAPLLSLVIEYMDKRYFSLTPDEEISLKRNYAEKVGRKERKAKRMLSKKKHSLERRVGSNLVKSIYDPKANIYQIPSILLDLQSGSIEIRKKGIEKAQTILQLFHTQLAKKMIIHMIGLTSISLTVVGLALFFTSCPTTIPFILFAIGGAMWVSRYSLTKGWANTYGWRFSIRDVPPKPITKTIEMFWYINLYFYDIHTYPLRRLLGKKKAKHLKAY